MTHSPHAPRAIRIFLSSTFADMQVEREELVKRVFPALRKLCAECGVTFTEVDLLWGVTDVAKAEGQVDFCGWGNQDPARSCNGASRGRTMRRTDRARSQLSRRPSSVESSAPSAPSSEDALAAPSGSARRKGR